LGGAMRGSRMECPARGGTAEEGGGAGRRVDSNRRSPRGGKKHHEGPRAGGGGMRFKERVGIIAGPLPAGAGSGGGRDRVGGEEL